MLTNARETFSQQTSAACPHQRLAQSDILQTKDGRPIIFFEKQSTGLNPVTPYLMPEFGVGSLGDKN